MSLTIPTPTNSQHPSSQYNTTINPSSNKCITNHNNPISTPIPISTNILPKTTTSLLTQSKQQLSTLQSIQNGFYVANLYKRFEVIDKVLFTLLLMNFVGIGVYVELAMKLISPMTHKHSVDIVSNENDIQRIHSQCEMILWSNVILTALAIPTSLLRYQLQQSYEQVQKKHISPVEQLYELLMIIIQPLPFLEHVVIDMPLEVGYQGHVEMKLNLILVIFSIVKCLLIARYIFWHNLCKLVNIRSEKFFRPSYNRICKIYSCQNSYMHIMKCLFQQNFIVFIGGFYLICMTTSAYCLRIAQTYYDGRFINYANCLWLTLLSMTTVGYGETYVSTPIGIGIDCFLMFSGVVIVSLLVSSLNDFFSMGYRQKRSLTLMKRLRDKSELKQVAAKFIARYLQRKFLQKKYSKRIKMCEQQRLNCRLFHDMRMSLKCGKQKQLNLYRDMFNQFQSLKLQLDELMKTCQQDIQTLSQKQRLTLNRQSHRSSKMRNRSSSYLNILKMKSRDSRVSLMQPIFNNSQFFQFSNIVNNKNNTFDHIQSVNESGSDSDSSEEMREKKRVGVEMDV